MPRIAENTVVINSYQGLAKFPRWLEAMFVQHKYIVITWRLGLDRTLEQNSKLWPMLTDIARQVVWYGKKYDTTAWKDILTGSFRHAEFVPNTEGTGFVVLGLRTSKMNRKDFSALIEFIIAFGTTQGVVWSERSKQAYEESREAA
jgi:hypothetical protein